jgi:type I restriction enzyme, S subunit
VNVAFRPSDVGVVPDDWAVARLDSLGRRGRSAVKAGPFGSAITKSLYVPSGYKVYGQEQVLRGDHLYGDYFVSAGKFAELKSCSVAPGDVLMTLVGTVGRVLVVPKDALPGIINPRLIRFSLDQQRVFPAFFGALHSSARCWRRTSSNNASLDTLRAERWGC